MAKGLVEISEHLSPFHDSFSAPRRPNNCHCFRSRHPIPSNHCPGKVPRQGLWTISLCRRHCRELGGCTSKNHLPHTPSRMATVAPPFFMPPLPSYPPSPLPSTTLGSDPGPSTSISLWLPYTFIHSSNAYLPPYPSCQPTPPLMPTRTRDTRRICPHFCCCSKNSPRKTGSGIHDAWRILRQPSTALLYMPGLRMVDHSPGTNSNRDFRGRSLLSSPKFFQSLTSRVLAARLARTSNSIAALLVFELVLTQVMWWSFVQAIVFSLK